MIKIFCDCCGQEPVNPDFVFEATIMEIGVTLNAKDITAPSKQIYKRMIQICQECYKKNIEPILKV